MGLFPWKHKNVYPKSRRIFISYKQIKIMKKLLLLISGFVVAASCTSPKSEVNTPGVEDAVVETVVDSTSIE